MVDLKLELMREQVVSCLPLSPVGEALIIEDETLARKLVAAMLAAGTPLLEFHVV